MISECVCPNTLATFSRLGYCVHVIFSFSLRSACIPFSWCARNEKEKNTCTKQLNNEISLCVTASMPADNNGPSSSSPLHANHFSMWRDPSSTFLLVARASALFHSSQSANVHVEQIDGHLCEFRYHNEHEKWINFYTNRRSKIFIHFKTNKNNNPNWE